MYIAEVEKVSGNESIVDVFKENVTHNISSTTHHTFSHYPFTYTHTLLL